MDIEQLGFFLSIAEGMTFQQTADQYNTSASSISKSIQKLEAELDAVLLDRSRRAASLTPAGVQLYNGLKKLRPQYESLMMSMREFSLSQSISLFIKPTFPDMGLTQCIDEFSSRHPNYNVAVSRIHHHYADIFDCLKNGGCDFAVMHKPYECPADFDVTPLHEDRLLVILPFSHPLANCSAVKWSDIKDETFILNQHYTELYHELYPPFQFTTSVKHYTDSRLDIFLNVSSGLGISLFFESELIKRNQKLVVAYPILDLPSFPIVLTHYRPHRLSRVQKEFKSFLISNLQTR